MEEPKPKQPRSEKQLEALAAARIKCIEARKKRAEEKQIKQGEKKIETKLTEIEKDKEILKLKQVALEQELDVEIRPKSKPKKEPLPPRPTEPSPPQPPPKEPSPPPPPAPEPASCFKMVNGNLLFYE